jgi:hypothetical protein
MTNHQDELRIAPDPAQAEALRQHLHARLASGGVTAMDEQPAGAWTPSFDTDADPREGDLIMLETEDRPAGRGPVPPPRRPSPGRWLLVAAAVAVVAVVATVLVANSGDDEDPVDTVTPTPTTAPAQDVLAVPGARNLDPGRYFIDPDGDASTPLRIAFQVALDGWEPWIGAMKPSVGGHTSVSITTVTNVVADGCFDHSPLDPPVGPTVDDLATALAQLEPFEVTAPPTEVTAFGYSGKHLALRVPDLRMDPSAENFHDFADCLDGELHSWISTNNDGSFYGYEAPGHTEEFWILDVQGTRLVLVKGTAPQTPAKDLAERDAIFDSIRIEP